MPCNRRRCLLSGVRCRPAALAAQATSLDSNAAHRVAPTRCRVRTRGSRIMSNLAKPIPDYNWQSIPVRESRKGIMQRVFRGNDVLIGYSELHPHMDPSPHSHPYEQIFMIVQGRVQAARRRAGHHLHARQRRAHPAECRALGRAAVAPRTALRSTWTSGRPTGPTSGNSRPIRPTSSHRCGRATDAASQRASASAVGDPGRSRHADRQRLSARLRRPRNGFPGAAASRFAQRLPVVGVSGHAVFACAPRDRAEPAPLLSRKMGRPRQRLFPCAACG